MNSNKARKKVEKEKERMMRFLHEYFASRPEKTFEKPTPALTLHRNEKKYGFV